MKRKYQFKLVAYTDAAGKFDSSAPRDGNEDNMFFCHNFGGTANENCNTGATIDLDEYGLLMVVADGMGGMNAGEVASQIAVDTVRVFFAPSKINKKVAEDDSLRQSYLEKIIVAADEQVKLMANQREDRKGMGSTLIMMWLTPGKVTVSWIGDSRAYRYNPAIGLQPLSKDHSYVQELVDSGQITYEQAFDHPQGNIVTRSLGDMSKKAKPETRHFKVYDGDILLLCSDGLTGVLRDSVIQKILEQNGESLPTCREKLWNAAQLADWYDNVTLFLCAVSGGDKCPENLSQLSIGPEKPFWKQSIHVTKRTIGITSIALLILIAVIAVFLPKIHWDKKASEIHSQIDSLPDSVVTPDVPIDNQLIDQDIPTQRNEDNLSLGRHRHKLDETQPAIQGGLTSIETQVETAASQMGLTPIVVPKDTIAVKESHGQESPTDTLKQTLTQIN